MAYGVKYRLDYCSDLGVPLRLDILKKDYTGAIIGIAGTGEPFTTTYKDTETKDEGISSSSSTINILDNGAFNIAEMYTSDERTFKVNYYVNSILAWTGWLMPDYGTSEYKHLSELNIPVSDGLSLLKNVAYVDSSGNAYTGRQSLLTVVLNCLSKTSLDLNLSVLNGITSTEWSAMRPEDPPNAINTILSSTYINAERFSDSDGNIISCYDVLETTMTLISSTLRQEGGRWSIFNIEQRTKGIGNIDSFSATGARLGRTSLVPKTIKVGSGKEAIAIRGMSEKIEPIYANTEIYTEHGPYLPLIDNIRFEGYNIGVYPGWTNVNGYSVSDSNVEVSRYNLDGTIYESKVVDSYYPAIASGVIFNGDNLSTDTSPYMKSSEFPLIQGEKLTVRINLRGYPQDKIYVVVKAGYYYLTNDQAWKRPNTGDPVPFLTIEIPLGGDRPGNQKPFAVSQPFEIQSSVFNAHANAEIRIYGHQRGGSASKSQMTILGLDLIKEAKDLKLAKGIVYSVVNVGQHSYVPKRRLTLFSDYVSAGESYSKNTSGIRPSRGGSSISNPNEKITSVLLNREGEILQNNWKRVDVSENRYLNQIAAFSSSLLSGLLTKSYRGEVRCNSFIASSKFEFDCNNGNPFLFSSGTINYKSATCSGVWFQMNLTATEKDTAIYADYDGEKSESSGVRGIGGAPSGGSGSAPQDLQSVTDIGPETTNIITARGLRALDLFQIPDEEPPLADRIAGKTYIFRNKTGSGAQPIPPLGNLEDLQNVANPIAINKYLFKGSDGIWRGVDINLPDLTGYATQSWVTTQLGSYVPTSRTINGKALTGNITLNASDVGALTQATADGRYVTLATKQTVTGAKNFSGALGIPNDEPLLADRVAGVTYLYRNATGGGSTPPPALGNLEDLQNVQNVIANGKYLQKIGGIWTGVDIPIPDLSGYALESWVTAGFAPLSGYNKANWDTAYGWGNHAGRYLPLSGGILSNASFAQQLTIHRDVAGGYSVINFSNTTEFLGRMGFSNADTFVVRMKLGDLNVWEVGANESISRGAFTVESPNSNQLNIIRTTAGATGHFRLGVAYESNTFSIHDVAQSTTERFRIRPDGSVGIGRYDSTAFFTVRGGRVDDVVALFENPAVNGSGILVRGGATSAYLLDLRTMDNVYKFRFLPNGNMEAIGKIQAPSVRATQALGIPNGAPPVAQREAGVTYLYRL